MEDKQQIISLIDELLLDIKEIDFDKEDRNGWSKLNQPKVISMLETIRSNALSHKIEFVSIPRGMDSFGIIGGDLVGKAAEITCLILDYLREEDEVN